MERRNKMTTLKEKVLAECKEWENTDDTLNGIVPVKVHPTGWEIWAVDGHYEFHRHDSQSLYIDLDTYLATDDDYAILAKLLGIGGEE